jgi:hypothetical protein
MRFFLSAPAGCEKKVTGDPKFGTWIVCLSKALSTVGLNALQKIKAFVVSYGILLLSTRKVQR